MRNQVGFRDHAVIGEHPGDRREAHPGLDLDAIGLPVPAWRSSDSEAR